MPEYVNYAETDINVIMDFVYDYDSEIPKPIEARLQRIVDTDDRFIINPKIRTMGGSISSWPIQIPSPLVTMRHVYKTFDNSDSEKGFVDICKVMGSGRATEAGIEVINEHFLCTLKRYFTVQDLRPSDRPSNYRPSFIAANISREPFNFILGVNFIDIVDSVLDPARFAALSAIVDRCDYVADTYDANCKIIDDVIGSLKFDIGELKAPSWIANHVIKSKRP